MQTTNLLITVLRSKRFLSLACDNPFYAWNAIRSRNIATTPHFQRKSLQNKFSKCSLCKTRKYSSEASNGVLFTFQNGLPVVSIPLPSRKEMCNFVLRPVSSTVGDFLANIQQEDQGIDRAVVYSTDGCRIAASTQIEHLLKDSFVLHINDQSYQINPPQLENSTSESTNTLDQTKVLISQLYGQLNIEEHQIKREKELLHRLENLQTELQPLEQKKKSLSAKASKRTTMLMWGGLAAMGTQFGLLARLTWWEYSWDIMEPVTYFITYGTAIVMYGYFILTQQEYIYPDARDRQYMRFFYKQAERTKFDVDEYNRLCNRIAQAEQDLQRLRDPLQLHLPAQPITVDVERLKGGKP